LNRGAVEEIEFDHSHISGGLSKIQTADNVFGIFTSRAMRERGRYQIQLMKTRSSSGVGAKIDLGFDIDCLRITNLDEDDDGSGYGAAPQSSIMDSIKRNTSVSGNLDPDVPKEPNEGAPIGKVRAETDSTKLRSFLANLGDDDE
jgi:hypothetical protein